VQKCTTGRYHSESSTTVGQRSPLGRNRDRGHVANLLDQELSLVDELFVVCPILEKVGKESKKLIAVHEKNFLDSNGFVRVGNKDLEYVEPLVLNHFPIIAQEVHAYFEVLATINISSHYAIVGTIQQDLTQELNRLTFGHVTVRLDQDIVVFVEEKVKVRR
jgi:hypothetical protein